MRIDLTEMPSGKRYEDRYGAYMEIFKKIAYCNDQDVIVDAPPASWVPLLKYLNVEVSWEEREYFKHDYLVAAALSHTNGGLDRTAVEVLCGFRPETTDALWKVDMQWDVAPRRRAASEKKKEFIVTNNGSFHRSEVMNYILVKLAKYEPTKKKVVLVPCAADKPYPSRMHKAVLDRMPEDYYLANATGVLGLVPQDLWPVMPHYDSGLPGEWRVVNILEDYFGKYEHEHIVAYLDYYSLAVQQAFKNLGQLGRVTFCLPVKFYYDYENLLAEDNLKLLEKAFER